MNCNLSGQAHRGKFLICLPGKSCATITNTATATTSHKPIPTTITKPNPTSPTPMPTNNPVHSVPHVNVPMVITLANTMADSQGNSAPTRSTLANVRGDPVSAPLHTLTTELDHVGHGDRGVGAMEYVGANVCVTTTATSTTTDTPSTSLYTTIAGRNVNNELRDPTQQQHQEHSGQGDHVNNEDVATMLMNAMNPDFNVSTSDSRGEGGAGERIRSTATYPCDNHQVSLAIIDKNQLSQSMTYEQRALAEYTRYTQNHTASVVHPEGGVAGQIVSGTSNNNLAGSQPTFVTPGPSFLQLSAGESAVHHGEFSCAPIQIRF